MPDVDPGVLRAVRGDELETTLALGREAVAAAVETDRLKPSRTEVIRTVLILAFAVSLLLNGVTLLVALGARTQASEVATRLIAAQESAASARATDQARVDEAIVRATAANADLVSQGLPPVPLPEVTDDPVEAIVKAAVPQVLAALPEPTGPTAEALGQGIANYLQSNPPGVPPGQVAQAVAEFLAANPPEPGLRGEPGLPGEPGSTPTRAEIEAAFASAVAADPDLVCAGQGGTFTFLSGVQLVDGRAFDTWTCLVEIREGPPPPTVPPATSTAPTSAPPETEPSPTSEPSGG